MTKANCCEATPAEQKLLDDGDYTPEELYGVGGRPSCPKCSTEKRTEEKAEQLFGRLNPDHKWHKAPEEVKALYRKEATKTLEDLKAERLLAETMRVQKEDFMKLADERRFELEALKEELANHDSASELIRVWIAENKTEIPWTKAIEIIAVATKMSEAERQCLLRLDYHIAE